MQRRTLIIATAVAGGVVVLGLVALLVGTLVLDGNARRDYDDSARANARAIADLNSAQRALNVARQSALVAASSGQAVGSLDPALVGDTATLDALSAAIEPLITAAGLVEAEDALTTPEPLRGVTVPDRDLPAGRSAQTSAAAELRGNSADLATQAAALTAQAATITAAEEQVHAATAAVAASAYQFGSTAATPARASADSVAAFSAAVAALATPAENADLAALVIAYRDAWNATVASDAAARSTSGAAAATYIKGVLIVNKTYGLPSTFGNGLTAETTAAFAAMQADAAAQGLNIYISSGFRSFSSQTSIYNRYKANEGQAGADTHSARPGHSEHQSGLAFDLNSITQSFGSTPEGIWVAENAHLYGFIVRYPQGKESITGYIWEPWHLRYLGVDLATSLYSSGQTLEEYLGVTSVYN
jgi:LAS superfamily LD-carboxypeptidase LdcB